MKIMKFKTDMHCEGCKRAVTPHLEKLEGVKNWNVELGDPSILEIEGEDVKEGEVVEALKEAGYKAGRIEN